MTRAIAGLSEIADRYDLMLCDVWGVVHNGREAFPEACEAMARFADERGPVVLISNAPRPSTAVVPQLDQYGVSRKAWSAFVTSGDATRVLLAARAPGPAWAIGPERDAPLYEGLDLKFAGPGEAEFISCTGLFDDDTETPEDYRDDLTVAASRGLVMVCANPDIVVQRGDELIYCAGALAQVYEELGGRVLMAGKPFAPIYDQALAEGARVAGRRIDRSRVLCVGDGLPTDVAGADLQGLDCLFVLAGIHAAEGLEAGELLAEAKAEAAWHMPMLAW